MVAHGPHQQWHVLGVQMTTQVVMLIVSLVCVSALIGLAVLAWLEHLG
jgi:hypothetical protein